MPNRCTVISSVVLSLALGVAVAGDCLANQDRDQKQAELDAACEQAREARLAPLREQFVEDCVRNGEQPDRRSCEVFYADYGAQSGNRAPLFYDLPECVEAFEYQNSQRQR